MKNFTKLLMLFMCSTLSFGAYAWNDPSDSALDAEPPFDPDKACYASNVLEFVQKMDANGNPVSDERSNAQTALGMPDMSNAVGGFVSLGMGGHIVLEFAGAIFDAPGDDILVYETSYSGDECGFADDEMAIIELSQDGVTWVNYGVVCRDASIDIAGLGLEYVTQIKITDVNNSANDGYDVDGVVAINGCQDIPDNACYASEVVADSYLPGLQKDGSPITDARRLDTSNALGKPQGTMTYNFVSLGYGGQITVAFDGIVYNNPGDDIEVIETTFNNYTYNSYAESADVHVSQNGIDFYYIGSVKTNERAKLDIDNAPVYLPYITQVRVIDTTPANSVSNDGFDLDGVVAINGCSPAEDITYAGCYATDLLEYVMGTNKNGGAIDNRRTATPENVLGKPERTDAYVFTSLGYGGSMTLAFDGAVKNGEGADLMFVETSFNTKGCEAYPEYADVYVSFDGYSWHFASTICKANNKVDISDAGEFEYINFVKIVNNDQLSTTPDGYDLDGVIAIHTCEDDTTMGVNDLNDDIFGLKTYPNPTSGLSNISFKAPTSGKLLVEVYDIVGRNMATVYNNDVNASQNYNLSFDGSSLPNGMYIYKVSLGNTTSNLKFVISH